MIIPINAMPYLVYKVFYVANGVLYTFRSEEHHCKGGVE